MQENIKVVAPQGLPMPLEEIQQYNMDPGSMKNNAPTLLTQFGLATHSVDLPLKLNQAKVQLSVQDSEQCQGRIPGQLHMPTAGNQPKNIKKIQMHKSLQHFINHEDNLKYWNFQLELKLWYIDYKKGPPKSTFLEINPRSKQQRGSMINLN